MSGRAKRAEAGILRSVVSIVPLCTVVLVLIAGAAHAVVDPTPTPGSPPHTETSEASSSGTLDRRSVPDESLLALRQPAGAEDTAAEDAAAPIR